MKADISIINKMTVLSLFSPLLLVFSLSSMNAHAEEAVDGNTVYKSYCAVCHKPGLNAAPKFGEAALWTKRVAQGKEAVYANAINGFGAMPARGGIAALTDAQVKAATDFMVESSGGWGNTK